MAYEAEKSRLYSLIETKTGRTLVRNSHLEREADERALEARNQVGLTATGTTADNINHDTDMWEELPTGITTYGENAAWFYLWRDPVGHAADAWWTSTTHRNNLLNPNFTNWGLGIYTEFPPGETSDLLRRWYFICIFTNNPETTVPEPIPVTPQGDCPTLLVPAYNRKITVYAGVNVRTSPSLASDKIDYMTITNESHRIVGTVQGADWKGVKTWYVLRNNRGWRYVNSYTGLTSSPTAIE